VDLDSLTILDQAERILPNTGWVEERAGKRLSHWWYYVVRVPAHLEARTPLVRGGPRTRQFKRADKSVILEIKAGGSQAIVPPSIWTRGEERQERYWVRHGAPALVSYEELLAACECLAGLDGWRPVLPETTVVWRPCSCGDDQAKLFERARRYLQRVNGAVSGQGGFRYTYHTVCLMLRNFGTLSDHDLASLLQEWNAAKNLPPWREDEIRAKLSHARLALAGQAG